MSDHAEPLTFDVMQQFVVRPDRRYRVEHHDGSLVFRKTGSQFDKQWLARGARSTLGDGVAESFEGASRKTLFFGGIGVAGGAATLLVLIGVWAAGTSVPLRRPHLTAIGVLVFALVVGLVMIIAGIATQRGSASGSRQHFSLPISDIVEASLLPAQSELARRGEPQVARLQLQSRSAGAIRLAIPTDADLESVRRVIPQLAA